MYNVRESRANCQWDFVQYCRFDISSTTNCQSCIFTQAIFSKSFSAIDRVVYASGKHFSKSTNKSAHSHLHSSNGSNRQFSISATKTNKVGYNFFFPKSIFPYLIEQQKMCVC